MENENSISQIESPTSEVVTATPEQTPSNKPKSGGNIWKISGIIAVCVIIIFGLLIWLGSSTENQNPPQSETQTNTAMETTKTDKINFPTVSYKEFALSDNTDTLDPKIAAPNVTEYGLQHLEIVQKYDGYATVSANLLAATINVPLGWESRGGFDAFDKIFFYPKGTIPSGSSLPTTYVALKVLDSSGLGASDFDSVIKKLDEMYTGFEADDEAYKTRVVTADPANKTFAFEVRGVIHAVTGKPQGVLDIYMQDPNAGSPLWADLQLSAPNDQFEKFKGLEGLMYKDLQINWADLEQLAAQSE